MTRNYTRELRRAQAEGAVIVGAMQPFMDDPMSYEPRLKGDPLPWVPAPGIVGRLSFRFNGRELKAVTPNGGGPWSVARLLP